MITSNLQKRGPSISFWKLFVIFVTTLSICAAIILIFLKTTPKEIPKVKELNQAQIDQLLNNQEALQKGYIQYQLRCARCHGSHLEGSRLAPSLIDNEWKYGNDFASIHRVITIGIPKKGMPSWGNQLLEEDLQDLTGFIIKMGLLKNSTPSETSEFKRERLLR